MLIMMTTIIIMMITISMKKIKGGPNPRNVTSVFAGNGNININFFGPSIFGDGQSVNTISTGNNGTLPCLPCTW